MIKSTKPQLSFELGAGHLHSVLRVDQIRTDTLVQLVTHWGDPDARDDVIAALDELAAVMQGPRREGELDAALEQVEDVAGMESAHVEVSMADTHRLHAELTAADRVLSRFNPERRTA
ncbi:hypothetical protein RFN58_07175 [Streptomyces iakyrus]|uniref:hypothetical protein n=1 Tax=Streptomyces iakyrus TaxID=68219 RepID=UPI000523F6F1|nr:hypothetical protein [Streptomyces iakyrus]